MASPRVGWAVGQTGNRTLIVRWNGNTWKRVSSPDVTGLLTGVTATSAWNAWAVGVAPIFFFSCALGRSALARVALLGVSPGRYRSLIWHWNGRAWKQVATPGLANGSGLFGVDATSAGNAWAVGGAGNNLGPDSKAVVLRWNGSTWK